MMLRDGAVSAGSIAGAFDISRPAVSRHLRVLREAGLVRDELHGRERLYQLALAALTELEAFLSELHQTTASTWERRFMALETEVHRVRRRDAGAKQATEEPIDEPVRSKKEKTA